MSPRMSPSLGGTAARARRAVGPMTLSVAMTVAVPGLAQAEPENPNSLSALVGAVADANQRLQDISAQVRFLTQVKAIVRAMPVQAFADLDARLSALNALQEALDQLIEQEELQAPEAGGSA